VPAAETPAVSDAELRRLFDAYAPLEKLALAVSGGADSLALMLLAVRWRALTPEGPELLVLTVDHGLRPESASEARFVVETAARHGLSARVLTWADPHPTANLEAEARSARYRLLVTAAVEVDCRDIATAHHQEDQAETFLLRLKRGSGVYGLAGMASALQRDGVRIVRPLLGMPRATLHGVVEAAGLVPVVDPHNADPRFDRTRARALLPILAEFGIDAERVAATATRLGRAAAALDAVVDRLLVKAAVADDFGGVRLSAAAFRAEPEEIRLRALARILRAVGGAGFVPRLESVETLERAMRSDAGMLPRTTLAGVIVDLRKESFRFQREAGRDGLPVLAFHGDFDGIWDGRFRITASANASTSLQIGPLGAEGRRALATCVPKGMSRAIEALPALRADGVLIAVPSLGVMPPAGFEGIFEVRPMVALRLFDPLRYDDL
jgi:tRNA(Ile)-lysidine synthase